MSNELTLIAAGALALILTGLSRSIARMTGAVSVPKCDRWHRIGSIPRLSGPALLLALLTGIEIGLFAVLAAFCAVGVWDDHRSMRSRVKAGFLVVPCVLAGWLSGELWIAAVCWVSAIAMNMLDNADGTAASTCAGSLLVLDGPLGMTGAGVCLGFLAHNLPPARAFLGDGGSLMLGALLPLAWLPYGPAAVLAGSAVPIIEAAIVICRRVQQGRAPWVGGVDHFAHGLLRAGVAPRWLPLLYGSAAAGLALLGKTLI